MIVITIVCTCGPIAQLLTYFSPHLGSRWNTRSAALRRQVAKSASRSRALAPCLARLWSSRSGSSTWLARVAGSISHGRRQSGSLTSFLSSCGSSPCSCYLSRRPLLLNSKGKKRTGSVNSRKGSGTLSAGLSAGSSAGSQSGELVPRIAWMRRASCINVSQRWKDGNQLCPPNTARLSVDRLSLLRCVGDSMCADR